MLADRVYRTLLWFYPGPFRREYGSEMTKAFVEQMREARRSDGWFAAASIWLETFGDLLVTAPTEHYHFMTQDLRYALRTLAAQPGFTAVAVLSLALGIGANTAIFSLLNSVLISALPVRDPQSLVMLTEPADSGVSIGYQSGDRSLLTYSEFIELRDKTGVFSELMASQAAIERVPVRLDGGEPEEARTRMVSADYFTTLGVPALLGRTFIASDNPTTPNAVISYDYWQRRFARRADILGTRVTIRGNVFSVIGVAPASFFGETVGERPDVWLPLTLQPAILPARDWLHDKNGSTEKVMWLHAFGRLKPGVQSEQAQAAANVVFQQTLADLYGPTLTPEIRRGYAGQRLKLRQASTGASQIRGQFAEPLTILLYTAGAVLLIACANVGNLLLARTTARTREISVRVALGAGRGRLIRHLLAESMLIAVAAGIAGLAAASIMRAGLLTLVPESVDLPGTPDARVLAFSFVLTLAAGLLLGCLPAVRALRVDANGGLKEQGRAITASRLWRRTGKFVVVAQLALSLPLLVGAGLLMRTFYNLQRVDLGYARERLLMVKVDVQTAGYEEQQRLALFERLFQRVSATPGVRAATYSKSGFFLGSDSGDEVLVEGYTRKGDNDRGSRYDHVGPNFFSTLGIPILLGREITDRDQPSSPRVCVINEAFAKRFFADRNPIGMHITQVFDNQRNTFQVVGVAKNSRKRSLRGEVEQRFFVPMAQPIEPPDFVTFALRTAAEPSSVIAGARRAILSEDPNLPIPIARPLEDAIDERMLQDRILARLSLAFGFVALLLAAIGLYGVLSYGVARRTNEIGIRKALGAQHGTVIAMILRETGLLLSVGLMVGVGLSAAAVRLITSRLYGLAPTDPIAITIAVVLLGGVALLAGWLPARRASRVDPLVALRYE